MAKNTNHKVLLGTLLFSAATLGTTTLAQADEVTAQESNDQNSTEEDQTVITVGAKATDNQTEVASADEADGSDLAAVEKTTVESSAVTEESQVASTEATQETVASTEETIDSTEETTASDETVTEDTEDVTASTDEKETSTTDEVEETTNSTETTADQEETTADQADDKADKDTETTDSSQDKETTDQTTEKEDNKEDSKDKADTKAEEDKTTAKADNKQSTQTTTAKKETTSSTTAKKTTYTQAKAKTVKTKSVFERAMEDPTSLTQKEINTLTDDELMELAATGKIYDKRFLETLTIRQSYARTNTTDAGEAFIKKWGEAARKVAQKYGVYASVMMAQAMLESGYGQSELASVHNNLFGIKAGPGYTGKKVLYWTKEYINGQGYTVQDYFRHYDDLESSFIDNALVIRNGTSWDSSYYKGAWKENCKSYKDATQWLQGRYATDPTYASKLNRIIEQYNLTRFDTPSSTTATTTPKPSTTTSSNGDVYYTVQKGDTLSKIAN